MNNVLQASLEAIDFQRDSKFIAEMAMQVTSAQKDPSKSTLNKVSQALHAIAKKYTGMHFNFHFAKMGGINAFVLPPQAESANPMSSDEVFKTVRRYNRPVSEQELFKGTVDITTGKVSGIYTQIPVEVFTAVEFFKGRAATDFEPEQIAAVILHEIGHGFTYLRYLGKLALSNVVVAEITRRQHEGEGDKVMQEVVRVAEQKTGWRLRDLGEINNRRDPLVTQQVVMAAMVESIRSELGTKFYDRRAFEFSADQFVARHGGQQYIVQALDTMYRQYPEYIREYRGRTGNIAASLMGYVEATFMSAMTAAGAYLLFAGPVGMGAVGLLSLVMGGFSVIGILFAGVDDGIYDPIEHRFKAMRRELIASAKYTDLPVATRKQIVKQMEEIDAILREVEENGKGYFHPDVLTQYVIGVFTGRPAEQKFQRTLEELVNNRLFELSNKLQTV